MDPRKLDAGVSTMNQPKYFLYARKSTDEDDRPPAPPRQAGQILSIESQLTELREFARKERLTFA
jgi:DNA invertase Pin-like site-specific DNA recombinase